MGGRGRGYGGESVGKEGKRRRGEWERGRGR